MTRATIQATQQEKAITDGYRSVNLRIQVARPRSSVPDISRFKIETAYGDDLYRTPHLV